MRLPEPNQKLHLYFIITIPSHHNGLAIVVSATSHLDPVNPLCVLQPGDPPSIKHRSYINYASLYLGNIEALDRAFLDPDFPYRRDQKASPETVHRIQQGALKWPRLESEQRYLIERAISEG